MARLLYYESPPEPRLAHAVDCWWWVSVSPDGTGTPSHWVLPDGCHSLAVGVKRAWFIQLREPVLMPFRRPCLPDEEIVGIRFRPGIIPHSAMPGIRRRLRPGQTAAETLAILQDAVRIEVPDIPRSIDRMVSIVREGQGRIPMSAVAETVQLSQRHLERLCLSTVGLRPKEFARVTRLQAVVRRFITEPRPKLADCAAEFGFTDQTHMTREFSTLGHLTPAAYLRVIRDVGFLLENRLNTPIELPS
jgi:AraC-like DNA-binding protein